MSESVRLVIWDLDETFWHGTLTEGEVRFVPEHGALVADLARRGIMSSICSKNDLAPVRALLETHGVWDHFIFPSISWEPKGQRIASLIETVQLRPQSVLFIDDNPMNLAEAQHYAPGLQVADPSLIAALLTDPRFIGKDDSGLTRLAQYKLLETRKADEVASGSDNLAFLQSSDIRITIDHDVEANLDRAIELINRTNQLNFTKRRLPEDLDLARAELRSMLERYDANAGLVKVQDRYGDYGYVGFFLVTGHRAESFLNHFCFSCRTLNMGVETWVYRWLGRPYLLVAGEVVNDVRTDESPVEQWISLATSGTAAAAGETPMKQLVMRGGCDLAALSHYLAGKAETAVLELLTVRDERQIRIDHSAMLDLALSDLDAETETALRAIGYEPSDWSSALKHPAPQSTWFLSFWTDSFCSLYRHKTLGFVAPFLLPFDPHAGADITRLRPEQVASLLRTDAHRAQYDYFMENFEYVGRADETKVRAAMRRLLDRALGDTQIFVILAPDSWLNLDGRVLDCREQQLVNRWIRAELQGRPNVHLVPIDDFVEPGKPRREPLHFDRLTYKRAADALLELIGACGPGDRARALLAS
jgi:FkbH-like protein